MGELGHGLIRRDALTLKLLWGPRPATLLAVQPHFYRANQNL